MNQKLTCLIVEDEPLAAEVLKDYIEQLPHLQLVGICTDAIFALEKLQEEKVDVIFLDIHLPKLKGLDFIKTLKDPPHIILTTAHHQYALQGYELNILDYLLKPIEFERFLKAVNKLQVKSNTSTTENVKEERAFRFFNVNKKNIKIFLDEILLVESLKEYVRIYTAKKVIITKFQLGELEQNLNNTNLLRVHRSFLIAIDKIDAYSSSEIEIAGKSIPIGRTYQREVLKLIKK